MRRIALALSLAAGAALPREIEDDPAGRRRAEIEVYGLRSAETQLAILDEARAEMRKYAGPKASITDPGAVAAVNIGPTTSDFEYNGGFYTKIDSGRLRKVLPDPRDANVVYVATSGGGVWKTFDALNGAGPSWMPVTDGIDSLSIGSLAMNPAAPDALLLGLGDPLGQVKAAGVLHSSDGGATWSARQALTFVTGGNAVYTAADVRDIAFDPDGSTVLIATDVGLFRQTLGSLDFSGTGHHVDVDGSGGAIGAWSIAHVGPSTWLLTTEDYTLSPLGHLWLSTDDGASWTEISARLGSAKTDVRRMTLAAVGLRVYLAAENEAETDQKGFWRSDDGGATFSLLPMGAGHAPTNPTSHQPDLDVMHGQCWYNQMLVVDPANPDIVFTGGNYSLVRSTDAGATWTVMGDWLPFALATTGGLTQSQYTHADWHAAAIAHIGGVAYFYGGNDGGLTRASSNVLSGAPQDVTWSDDLNKGIVSHLAFSVAAAKERPPTTACTMPAGMSDLVYGGLQDNGTRIREVPADAAYNTHPTAFNGINGGDGYGVGLGCVSGGAMGSNLISTLAHELDWTSNGGACRTTGSGGFQCFSNVAFQQSGNSAATMNPPLSLDYNNTFFMRVATDLTADRTYLVPLTDTSLCGHVYRSTDGGATWNGIDGAITSATSNACTTAGKFPFPMRNVAADPVNAGYYAAVSNSARVYVTVDSGAHWVETSRPASLSGGDYITYLQTVAFDPTDTSGNTLWVGSVGANTALGGTVPATVGHLFVTANALSGASATWTPKHANLPNAPISVVKLNPTTSSTIYVGTEIGLYRSTDSGATFARYGAGLPLVSVTDLAVNWDGSAVRMSTFGRGFWEVHPDPTAPAGVMGNGDFDASQVIDGFDLVREAAAFQTDTTSPDYNAIGNLTGSTNVIDLADLNALIAKLGGRP